MNINPIPKVEAGPVEVSNADFAEALAAMDSWVRAGGQRFVCFCEANLLSNVVRYPKLKQILNDADAVFADGVALMKLAQLNGQSLPERIPGPTFILKACEYGLSRGWRHFFFGGGAGVADKLAEKLCSRFPGLQVAGTYSPPFRPLTAEEELDVKNRVEKAETDLLWVALGSPKQEFWVADMAGRIDVPVMLPVGAAFDFHAGTRPWAPPLIRKTGMEWLYRMLTGGKATFFRNMRCVSVVAFLLASAYLRKLNGKI